MLSRSTKSTDHGGFPAEKNTRHVPLWAQRSSSEVNLAKRHSLELAMRLGGRGGRGPESKLNGEDPALWDKYKKKHGKQDLKKAP